MTPSVSRVAARYLLARTPLSKTLQDAIKGYSAGKGAGDVRKALDLFFMVLSIQETPGEIGVPMKIHADWFYALGKIQQRRVIDTLKQVRDLRRWVRNEPDERTKDLLNFLVPEFKWLEARLREEEDEVVHGPFTLVKMPGVTRAAMEGAIEALDTAAGFIKRKFPQVVYGKVFVSPRLAHGVAQYVPEGDRVYLSLQAKDTTGDVHAICHEFGHRYYHRFWKDRDARSLFWRLSEDSVYEVLEFPPPKKEELAREMIEQVHAWQAGKKVPLSPDMDRYMRHINQDSGAREELREYAQAALKGGTKEEKLLTEAFVRLGPDEIKTDKVIRSPLAVTPYAAQKGWTENFAESFAFYVMGKTLPPEIQAIMEGLK
jgi:hypothetical protein